MNAEPETISTDILHRIGDVSSEMRTLAAYSYGTFLQQRGAERAEQATKSLQRIFVPAIQPAVELLSPDQKQYYTEKLRQLESTILDFQGFLSGYRDWAKAEIASSYAARRWSETIKGLSY